MTGTFLMAAGLGAVVFLNAAIAFIHINDVTDAERPHETRASANAAAPHAPRAVSPAQPAMSSGPAEVKLAQQTSPQEPLTFPVLGWYALPQEPEELPMDVVMKKPAKNRSAAA
jgi:hypothetical protein